MPKRKPPEFQIGDRIAYSVRFLKSTGQMTGYAPQMRATVIHVGPLVSNSAGAYIAFRDDNGHEFAGIAVNFTLVSRIAIDSAVNT